MEDEGWAREMSLKGRKRAAAGRERIFRQEVALDYSRAKNPAHVTLHSIERPQSPTAANIKMHA